MPLDPKLTKYSTQSPIMSVVDYTDFASGIGMETFYLYQTLDNGGATFRITGDSSIKSSVITDKGTDPHVTDDDYDTSPFNRKRVLNGISTINATIGGYKGGGGAVNVYLICTLYIVKSGVETIIGSAVQSVTFTGTVGATEEDSQPVTLEIDSGGRVIFQRDDLLRLRVQVVGSSGEDQGYGVDPAGRADVVGPAVGIQKIIKDGDSTQFKILIPFEVQ